MEQPTIAFIFLNPSIPYSILAAGQMLMADKAVSTVAKPQMRGLLNAAIKRNIYVGLFVSGVSAFAFKHFVGTERKKKYAEFYRNYDAEKEFEEMRKKGLFQSC